MGGTKNSGGVEERENSIRIIFSYLLKQRKETLYLDNDPLPPTPANVKYARRVAIEIKEKIRVGTFVYADYFPHSPMAAKLETEQAEMLHALMDRWLALLDLKSSTKSQYKTRINSFWKANLPNKPVTEYRYSDILAALNSGTWKSGKSRNNELSMISQVFEFALNDELIASNPCKKVDRASYQAPKPDPFSLNEIELILPKIAECYSEDAADFHEFMFFTGIRTNEGIGVQWPKVNLKLKEMKIDGGVVYDEETDSTKTSVSRIVKLNSRAMRVLERRTDDGGAVFKDSATNAPWGYAKVTDIRTYWTAALKAAGVRYRRPYNARHSYATIGLMAGANPAFLAKQLGHSLEMFFKVYADWISSDADDREMAKIEAALLAR